MKRIYAAMSSWTVVRFVLGLVLLTTASLKGFDLATSATRNTSFFDTRWFLIGLVEFELFLGIWLLAGSYARWSWRLAVLCFSCFGAIALYLWGAGYTSCGCFGSVQSHPRYMVFFDLAAVIALVECRATVRELTSVVRQRRAAIVVVVLALLLGVPAGVAMAKQALAPDGRTTSHSEHSALQPDRGSIVAYHHNPYEQVRPPTHKHFET